MPRIAAAWAAASSGQLHTARFAPATRLDLGLHDYPRRARSRELRRDAARLGCGVRDLAGRHRYPILSEKFLRLMLEQVHSGVRP
jgi:hypothetical protein